MADAADHRRTRCQGQFGPVIVVLINGRSGLPANQRPSPGGRPPNATPLGLAAAHLGSSASPHLCHHPRLRRISRHERLLAAGSGSLVVSDSRVSLWHWPLRCACPWLALPLPPSTTGSSLISPGCIVPYFPPPFSSTPPSRLCNTSSLSSAAPSHFLTLSTLPLHLPGEPQADQSPTVDLLRPPPSCPVFVLRPRSSRPSVPILFSEAPSSKLVSVSLSLLQMQPLLDASF
ncbi:hypothetical protein TOPH_02490 [Tolypocladium ophioglossoides CBS 100239]|uniref:Uncharacterized protein n=1 Tax=Tolypocladium ophioglossoides (strain CBS 100239) TaxID=1163406 RepID=A0A0L0NF21_TOLOC|nr:hypothetical protein TOPH_02490 [Tolypocladium ophioglossoides CBS 100239]